MIQFLNSTEIDPDKWDNTVRNSRFRTVFATYKALSLLTEDFGWNALIQDDYEYVMPLPERTKMGIHYICQPGFVGPTGIFSKKETTASAVLGFFNAIPEKYVQVDLTLNTQNALPPSGPFALTAVSHAMALDAPYENLAAGYSQNTRRNVKTARRQGLVWVPDGDLEAIIALFRQNRGKRGDVHYKGSDYRALVRIVSFLRKTGLAEVPEVHTCDGERVAGAVFVHDFGRHVFLFSGRDNRFADCRPMFFLLDEFVRRHAGSAESLDFNGSRDPNVARMYRGFGGRPYGIPCISHTRPVWWGFLLHIYKKLR